MVSIKDIVLEFSLIFLWFFGTLSIAAFLELPFLVFPFFILFISLKIYLKRRKKIIDFVKDDFQKLGYQLKNERPVTFKEFFKKVLLKVTPLISINDIPLRRYRYMRSFRRIFTVKSKNGELQELNTLVIHK